MKKAAAMAPMFVLLLALAPGPAFANAEPFALQSSLDKAWMITAAGLVFIMQAGFMLLEAGTVRAKNSVNVAQKNLVDFLISSLAFGTVGFALMFGTSLGGYVGWQSDLAFFGETDQWSATFFVFQLVFCGTAATIMSGAVAERMKLGAYMYLSLCIGLFIYPIVGHWTWGGLLNGQEGPWLADLGFMDFAGGTVVHSVGAWVGLVAIILLGPRLGKYDEHGRPIKIHGHSPILATVGAVILWVGWIGFNGGSTSVASDQFATIIRNTMVAAAAAGIASMLLSRYFSGCFSPSGCINGTLAGLVAVTPGCNVLTGPTALVVGLSAGLLVVVSERWFEHRLKLDDPLGAVSVHGVCGAFGTVMLAVLAPTELLVLGDRFDQIIVQLVGVVAIFLFCVSVTLLVLWPIRAIPDEDGGNGLRVRLQDEQIGLNVAEHDAPLGTGVLQAALERIAMDERGTFKPLEIERGDEAYEMAQSVNKIMAQMQRVIDALDEAVDATSRGEFGTRISLAGLAGAPKRLCEGLNTINSVCEQAFENLSQHFADLSDGQLFIGDGGLPKEGRFADLMLSLSDAVDSLRGLVTTTHDDAVTTVQDSDELLRISETLLTTLQSQTDVVVQSTDQLQDFATAMLEQSNLSTSTADKCAAARDLAVLGAENIAKSAEGMVKMEAAGQDIRAAISKIRTIANTTKLLAVNASIEAARASDTKAGRGFQNVASEIQRLAAETQSVVDEVVQRSENVSEEIETVEKLISETNDNLTKIATATKESATLSATVAGGSRTHSEQVTDLCGTITEASAASESSLAQMQDSQQIIERLSSAARKTTQSLSRFRTEPGVGLTKAA